VQLTLLTQYVCVFLARRLWSFIDPSQNGVVDVAEFSEFMRSRRIGTQRRNNKEASSGSTQKAQAAGKKAATGEEMDGAGVVDEDIIPDGKLPARFLDEIETEIEIQDECKDHEGPWN
jgi:hypothetical protein